MLRMLTITSFMFGFAVFTRPADAQMVHTSTPFPSIGSSYYESNSIGWSIWGTNWFANFGGGGPLLPPFGGVPDGGVSGGFGFGGGGLSGNLGFNFAQGSSQSINSTTPSLTTMNGFPGSISSGVVRPFVTRIHSNCQRLSGRRPVADHRGNWTTPALVAAPLASRAAKQKA